MRGSFLLTLSLLCLGFLGYLPEAKAQRNCGSTEHLQEQLLQNPEMQKQLQEIEQQTRQFVQSDWYNKNTGTITIPVVVHVIYSNSAENISDSQVQSQIDVLNEDFNADNADIGNVPAEFAPLVADIGIQFVLADLDPDGNPSNGITRKSSSRTSWGTNDAMKFSSQGGVDAWPADQYLNMWVCNIGGGILGYAQFPGGSAATDGVVVAPQYFGRTGNVSAPFNQGRTMTHEVGHWLNLRHIWGDGGCSVDDFVSDTPTSGAPNYGCPSYPTTNCGSSDMFMNYMDYVNDACMHMFSEGQKARMLALFAEGGFRNSFVSSSEPNPEPEPEPEPEPTPGELPTGYCASQGQTQADEWIDYVQLGDIERASGADGGYIDLTNLSTDLVAGSEQTISFSTGYSGTNYNEVWGIYIDYNRDGDFEDTGELVGTLNSNTPDTLSLDFTVPSSFMEGSTRMRVSMKYNSLANPCEAFTYGEVEDYAVNLVNAGTDPDPEPEPGGELPTGYCDATGQTQADEWIAYVELGNIQNTSGADGGYADNTDQSTAIAPGSTQTIVLRTGFAGRTYREGWGIYIDYNRDGDFEDAGELIVSGTVETTSNVSATFTVPTSASQGFTRLRVSMKYNDVPDPCETFTYGEVEDYAVNISSTVRSVATFYPEAIPIDQPSETLLEFYPNPAHQSVELTKTQSARVEITTLQGEVLSTSQIDENQRTIQLKGLNSGVYLMRIQEKNGKEIIEKIIIK